MALTFEQQRPVEMSTIGVGLILVPPRDATTNIPWTGGIEIERAPDSGGSPGTPVSIAVLDHVPPAGGRYIDPRPWTTDVWWYRYRPVRAGGVGTFGPYVSATPGLFPRGTKLGMQAGDAAAFYAGVRGEPLSDGEYALRSTTGAGLQAAPDVKLDPANGILEGGVVHKLYRHREEITVQGADADGDVEVTFAQPYQSAPMIFVRGGQYVTYSSVLGNVMQKLRLQALDADANGFTSRTQIVNTGVTTAQTDDFPAANLIDAVGETAEVNLDPGGANDDTYTVHYYVEVTLSSPGDDPNVDLTVAIETNDGSAWVERATFVYSRSTAGTSTFSHEQKPIVVSGLVLDTDIRLRAKSFLVHDATGSFKVQGGDSGGGAPGAFAGVTYTTATDDADSAIPDAGDHVIWVAQEVV